MMSQFVFPEFKQGDFIGAMMAAQQYRANESKLQQMQEAAAKEAAERERLARARALQGRALAGDNGAALALGSVDPKSAIETREFMQENQQKKLSLADLQRKQSLQKVGAAQNLVRMAMANPALTPQIQQILTERQLVPQDVWGNEPVTPGKLSIIDQDLEFSKTALQEDNGDQELAKIHAILTRAGVRPGTLEYSEQMRKHWDAKYLSSGGVSVHIGNDSATPKFRADMQSDIEAGAQALGTLQNLKAGYQESYRNLEGWARQKGGAALSFLGWSVDKDFRENKLQWDNEMRQFFNSYRKEITGAGAAVAELEALQESILSEKTPPDLVPAAIDQLMTKIARNNAIKSKLLKEGIPLGTEEYWRRFNQSVESEKSNSDLLGQRKQINDYVAELRGKKLTSDQIKAKVYERFGAPK